MDDTQLQGTPTEKFFKYGVGDSVVYGGQTATVRKCEEFAFSPTYVLEFSDGSVSDWVPEAEIRAAPPTTPVCMVSGHVATVQIFLSNEIASTPEAFKQLLGEAMDDLSVNLAGAATLGRGSEGLFDWGYMYLGTETGPQTPSEPHPFSGPLDHISRVLSRENLIIAHVFDALSLAAETGLPEPYGEGETYDFLVDLGMLFEWSDEALRSSQLATLRARPGFSEVASKFKERFDTDISLACAID